MKRLALLAALALLLTGCSLSQVQAQARQKAGVASAPVTQGANLPPCLITVAKALTSPQAPVAGVMACQGSSVLSSLNDTGIKTDSDFQQQIAAAPPVFTEARYLGRTGDGGYVFDLEGSSQSGPNSAVYIFWLDSSGKIGNLATAAKQ